MNVVQLRGRIHNGVDRCCDKWYTKGKANEGMGKAMDGTQERKAYPTDLTDSQWAVIEPLYKGMRTYKWSKRELTNAVLYLVDSGCKWRQLPHDFPPYSTVHSFYRRARLNGLWEKIRGYLVILTRKKAGRKETPTYGLVDSQSVKTLYPSEERGIDGGKKRKDASGIS